MQRTSLIRLWICYLLLLVYGTWFPLTNWDWTLGGLHSFLAMDIVDSATRSDFIINLMVYVPFGLLLMQLLSGPLLIRLTIVTLTSCLVSLTLEFGQTFLPGRVTALSDILLNTSGSLLGALTAGLVTKLPPGQRLHAALFGSLRNNTNARLGLSALALWALAQLSPFVPSFDLGTIKQGIAPLRAVYQDDAAFFSPRFFSYLLMLVGVYSVALATFKPDKVNALLIALAVPTVLVGKIFIVGRVLAPETLLACGCALSLILVLRRLEVGTLRLLAAGCLLGFYCYNALQPSAVDTSLRAINWIPFRGHMNSLIGIMDILDIAWVFVALAYVLHPAGRVSKRSLLPRGAALLVIAFAVEWQQQFIPGRFADVTDVGVAIAAWWFAASYPWHSFASSSTESAQAVKTPPSTIPAAKISSSKVSSSKESSSKVSSSKIKSPKVNSGYHYMVLALAGVAALVIGAVMIVDPPGTDDHYQLPTIDLLPVPAFPAFRNHHPRLPVPTLEDILLIDRHNPAFWQRHHHKAASGELYSRILLARVQPDRVQPDGIQPGTIDLDTLYQDLEQLIPTQRGHQQTIPLALAYDWLHEQWSPQQRTALLEKVEQACQYQVRVIRDTHQLSPYNVYLYNSPLQALFMAALASYQDSPDNSCMRFTADYWQHRVLPVWRQVMGNSGGWHEGGEYVGIGIGQAIYQLPALWRHATGEDLFSSEPGIRGFLDFALYRTRPDGTHMRLGDAAYFNRALPDLAPLAIEYQHRAAYTLAAPPELPTPTASPWGPLTQPGLADSTAIAALPLSRYFDGTGLLVARSDWSRDATYVTFKAGDNFWSHTHLDQGSFTIFRGGALAIDSGLYGTRSDSDHHRNYSSQSIAHNVVTVTDPKNTVPMPSQSRDGSARTIANDGGQRRVGSGWGKPAPLDHTHWQQHQDIYRTVGATLQGEAGNVIWKVADLTPAYTNSQSGKGSFTDRTLRVRSYQRTFIYARDRDLIIVYDRLTSADPGFRKKWLLHSLHEPQTNAGGFEITTLPSLEKSMAGGRLSGRVLLPEHNVITKIGGPGFEFFVDGVNYDEDGAVQAQAARKKDAEPGAWRLEIQPTLEGKTHEFLVVMRAELLDSREPLPTMDLTETPQELTLRLGGESPLRITIPRDLQPVQVSPAK